MYLFSVVFASDSIVFGRHVCARNVPALLHPSGQMVTFRSTASMWPDGNVSALLQSGVEGLGQDL